MLGMAAVSIFIRFNGHWDNFEKYVRGETKGVMVPLNTSYIGLLEMLINVMCLRGQGKSLVLQYCVEVGMTHVRIQNDTDVFFYLQLKKKDVHVLSKFPLCIDFVDESVDEALPVELGESNYIHVQRPLGRSIDGANQQAPIQNNIHSPEFDVNLNNEDGDDEEQEFNIQLGIDDDVPPNSPDRNNEIGKGVSNGAQSYVNGCKSNSVRQCNSSSEI